MHGMTFRTFHVWWTAPPLAAVFPSCAAPLAFTWVTVVRASTVVGNMLTVWVKLNHDFVIDLVHVVFLLGIFSVVVLKDEPLLAFLDTFPIGLESKRH